MEILIIIPVVFILSFVLGGPKTCALAVLSAILSIITYFIIGVNFIGHCVRFRSIPFGGCGYSDESAAHNLVFWFFVIFLIFLVTIYLYLFKKK